MKHLLKHSIILTWLIASAHISSSQINQNASSENKSITISAGPEYKTSGFHQWLWGTNYRKEWSTPVKLPVIDLRTELGGLTPIKAGGGNQTKSLQVESTDKKKYTLRTVNKTLGKVLPKNFQNTFIETIVNDKVSMSHPYGAAAVPVLAESAGIFHTNPRYVYLPEQAALDTFNKKFGNNVYLFEEKLDSDWKENDDLGNFTNYISTDNLLKKILDDNDNSADQKLFIKERLFDMLINDWDRHEDQWEWGKVEVNDRNIYKPVPQDRDQAFFTYNGVLLKFLMSVSGMKYFQPLKKEMPDVKNFNYEERNLDRFFANQLTLADWEQTAKMLQDSITDNAIESALKQLPPEVQGLSGDEIVTKLKARRDNLVKEAATYYKFIATEVDIVGSKAREHIEVNRINDTITSVKLFKINKQGQQEEMPFYSRDFKANETEEVRIYGISGNDIYTVKGDVENKIKVRLIGGDEKDSVSITGRGRVHVYDNRDNIFNTGNQTKFHFSNDSAIHEYRYKSFLYSKKGPKPAISFTNEDRLFVGLGYTILTNKWRRDPFAYRHDLMVNYSISQKAPRVVYNGYFPRALGKWDIALVGDYDAVRWTNFFGLGNETKFAVKEIDYYRARTEEWLGSIGLIRRFGHNTLRLNGFYQSIRVLQDTQKFIAKNPFLFEPKVYEADNFGGGQLQYTFVSVNDSIVPTKGVAFFGNGMFAQNLKDQSRWVSNLNGHLQLYIPLISKFSLALRAGSATVSGTPEFYQYASIGGGQSVRAFRRDRFWGRTMFYNSNEFRFISKVKSYLFNGKLGLVTFYDNGRVWMPNQKSNVWHHGYGAGVLISPFDKVLADVTYGISKDEQLIQLRFSKSF